jgi:hypothetical protein
LCQFDTRRLKKRKRKKRRVGIEWATTVVRVSEASDAETTGPKEKRQDKEWKTGERGWDRQNGNEKDKNPGMSDNATGLSRERKE